jgi:Uma2 family endonuclease
MLTTQRSTNTQRPMTWQDVLDDPSLKNLPYKIELDEKGRILMGPVNRLHTLYQARIVRLLIGLQPDGWHLQEPAVQTRIGVRVPDVAWLSTERNRAQEGNIFTIAPEICVEVLSPSNTMNEVHEKQNVYFEAGALEVWTCNFSGEMTFANTKGSLERSELVTAFPLQVELE